MVETKPLSRFILGLNPRLEIFATSSNLRGVPSGLDRSQIISPSNPVRREIFDASSFILIAVPEPKLM